MKLRIAASKLAILTVVVACSESTSSSDFTSDSCTNYNEFIGRHESAHNRNPYNLIEMRGCFSYPFELDTSSYGHRNNACEHHNSTIGTPCESNIRPCAVQKLAKSYVKDIKTKLRKNFKKINSALEEMKTYVIVSNKTITVDLYMSQIEKSIMENVAKKLENVKTCEEKATSSVKEDLLQKTSSIISDAKNAVKKTISDEIYNKNENNDILTFVKKTNHNESGKLEEFLIAKIDDVADKLIKGIGEGFGSVLGNMKELWDKENAAEDAKICSIFKENGTKINVDLNNIIKEEIEKVKDLVIQNEIKVEKHIIKNIHTAINNTNYVLGLERNQRWYLHNNSFGNIERSMEYV